MINFVELFNVNIMASIKSAYDLSGGDTRSSIINGGTYIVLHPFLSSVQGMVSYYLEKRNSSSGEWISVKDNNDEPIVFKTTNNIEEGVGVSLLPASIEYSVNIKPGANTTGNITLDAVTDGTIQ